MDSFENIPPENEKSKCVKFPKSSKEVPAWLETVKRKWYGAQEVTENVSTPKIAKKSLTLQSLLNVDQNSLLTHPWKIIQVFNNFYRYTYHF